MNKLAQKIIKIIKQKPIKPRPRWFFYLYNMLIWLTLLIWVILGGLASAMIIDNIRFNDWSLAARLGGKLIIQLLPIFWLIILAGAAIIAKIHFQKTKHGYRYPWLKIILVGLVISLLIGLILVQTGWSRAIDNQLAQQNLYRQLNCQDKLWFQPNQGLLIGLIKSLNNQGLSLVAPDNSTWLVTINNQTIIRSANIIKNGQKIKVLGKISQPKTFQANEIRQHQVSCGCGCGCNHCQCQTCQH